ncbi:ArsR/SmtB family transcription factor [Actinokineospora xionganensis]|uniref:Winged helix-turn-helix transcriptional regulator n=1 Tax=Actinokineospora xionganensis TaxID=2684470 RepID=A0ABR7LB49_9PSEU|nr:DUF5937 family protein [Actinokineospora xionganensis]MBC6449793.1 winged helix-turn-helix transcriptional regulator [Actinokineospora xionganensis]
MATELVAGADDLLRCRFALSPLWETIAAIRTLTDVRRQPYHLPWLRRVDGLLDADYLEPLLALLPHKGYTPDFLTPPPPGPLAEFDAELSRVVATDPNQVAVELHRCLRGPRTERVSAELAARLLGDPTRTLAEIATIVRTCWEQLIDPQWPLVRDRLEADIAVRARQLADGGLHKVLADLNPRVRWSDNAVRVDTTYPMRRLLGGQGLLLMPSVFVWPAVIVVVEPPWQPTLIYPVRGVAELWQARPQRSTQALARLIGRTRAQILVNLEAAASTGTLARAHGVSPATVSGHLAALRDTGLITSRRVGRVVLYERTALGATLTS